MFESFLNALRAPDIRRRILYVAGILVVFRFLSHVPVPGADPAALNQFFQDNQLFSLLDLFSGGGLSRFSVVGLGVNPYINASIIMQLMTGVIPALIALSREGEYGRNKINQYTRYLSVPLAMLQAYGFLALLNSQRILTTPFDLGLLRDPRPDRHPDGRLRPPHVARRAHHGEGDRQRHQLHHLRGHRRARAGRHPALPRVARPPRRRRLRDPRDRDRRGDHLHPGGPAPHPDPVREPRPRTSRLPGRQHVPPAAREPGGRHPDHLRGEHPPVPEPDRAVLHDLVDHDRRGRSPRGSSTSSATTSSMRRCTSS